MAKKDDPELTIAIQGVRASFHDMASRKFFKKSELTMIECSSFPKLFETLANKKADFAVMAIENAIAGSILPNYSLMEKFKFKIIGEVYIKIEMCLMALPGVKIEDLETVRSHPMALLQCQDYLSTLSHVTAIEASDTAESAKIIQDKKLKNEGAIAGRLAAEVFGLSILQENIETDRSNYTRFLVLAREEDYEVSNEANKSSLRFEVRHFPGSLAKILNIFNKHSVNLTKVQSLPILGKPYQYCLHADMEWENVDEYIKAMKETEDVALELIDFGHYPRGEKVEL